MVAQQNKYNLSKQNLRFMQKIASILLWSFVTIQGMFYLHGKVASLIRRSGLSAHYLPVPYQKCKRAFDLLKLLSAILLSHH